MEINQIQLYLNSSDSQERLKALTELRNYESEIAIPLLITRKRDPEFLVRSFVAMGLGNKRSPESFKILLEMMKNDQDYNVRAEAANSLSKFGEESIPHLLETFRQDDNWLVRRSILAPLIDMPFPEALYEVCLCAIAGEDLTVKEVAIHALGALAGTIKKTEALQKLLDFVSAESWMTRVRVAQALTKFEAPQAKAALSYLSKDEDHRVVGATLESSLS
ncbi:MAG: HEAT repeat domain-containing protein [Okeania sp. SIO3B5]|uniref:HEAT repeat domain-containing protein n=1 Tax=Okeania sp. SIO3B5 TaxID=2607811 RepID=UPI001400968D|nr:HEAT repeat domain-containing protein [Okeania sp. SIO3B5]NEO57278.1 HEAT repeat domain-containing protein [Okeania sp. SIO3B5]